MADDMERKVEKLIQPQGNILNDNDIGVDYLGHSIYAEALAEKIDRVSTPITIGVFARWGSGKTFLLKHVKNLLERKQRRAESEVTSSNYFKHWYWRHCYRTFLFLFCFLLIIVSTMWAAYPPMFVTSSLVHDVMPETTVQSEVSSTSSPSNVTTAMVDDVTPNDDIDTVILKESNTVNYNVTASSENPDQNVDKRLTFWRHFTRVIAIAILMFSLVSISIVMCGNHDWWSSTFFANFRLISFVAFSKLPIKSLDDSIVKEVLDDDVTLKVDVRNSFETRPSKKYIFVSFNAWQYAGSDTLWAGIVTALSNAIETEFGSVTSRLFRMLSVDVMPQEIKHSERRTLFMKLPNSSETSEIEDAMSDYGVVRFCDRLCVWRKRKKGGTINVVDDPTHLQWWVVEYSNCMEAQKARRSLRITGIDVAYDDPFTPSTRQATRNYLSSCKRGRGTANGPSSPEQYEMQVLTEGNSSLSKISSEFDEEAAHALKRRNFWKHFMQHPKTTCNFPNMYWWILMVLAFISLPVITYVLADAMELDIYRTGRAVPVVVQIVSWMPAVGAASFVIIKFVWAMFHSQRNRIHSALEGAKGNMAAQLGFMNKVKTEVQYITKLIECAEFTHNQQYRVIITIDDLDRIALEKIKSVLEAVSLLLSDYSSPFVCLIAVDSRVAVKCIEETMGSTLLRNGVNGHEYLKKIINLPFCLPEIDNKRKRNYIGGLMDLSDKTRKKRVSRRAQSSSGPPSNHPTAPVLSSDTPRSGHYRLRQARILPDGPTDRKQSSLPTSGASRRESLVKPKDNDVSRVISPDVVDGNAFMQTIDPREPSLREDRWNETPEASSSTTRYPMVEKSVEDSQTATMKESYKRESGAQPSPATIILTTKDFLFQCRCFLFDNEMVLRHLEGNPRNIKRIFNVLSLTSWILHCYDKQKEREKLLKRNSRAPSNGYCDVEECATDKTASIFSVGKTLELAQNLVVWVILTDQWPYRMSFLLEVMEDADQRSNCGNEVGFIDDDMSLYDIYKKHVEAEIDAIKSKSDDTGLLSLDVHPDMFHSFLREIKDKRPSLKKGTAKLLRQITINLDQSLRQTIVCQRDVASDVSDVQKRQGDNKPAAVKKSVCTCDVNSHGVMECDVAHASHNHRLFGCTNQSIDSAIT